MTYGGHPPISGSVSGRRMIPDRSFVSWPRAFRRAGITRPCGGLGYNKIPQGMASERWLRRNGFRSHNGGSRQDGGVPSIRGLRVPVATVVGMVADGMDEEEILRANPFLRVRCRCLWSKAKKKRLLQPQ